MLKLNGICISFLGALIQNLESSFGEEKYDSVFKQHKPVVGKNGFPCGQKQKLPFMELKN